MPGSGRVRRLTVWTIVIGVAIFALKAVAWWLTGSVALFSDAMESIVNVVASVAAWYAIRLSYTPADDNHPYGHHKAEYLSAVLEGVLIVVAALLIMREAALAFQASELHAMPVLGLVINGVAGIGNAIWAYVLIKVGREARSPALIADGRHLWTDVVTSAGVIVGLILALATGWLWLDPLMAVVVAINILYHGWKMVSASVQGLMDTSVDPQDLVEIEKLVAANCKGAIEFHDLKTREAGRARFIEFHLVVPSAMSVEAAHRICDRIEEAFRRDMSDAKVTIHVEPEYKAKHG
ncbi:cation diffusion facilitator family transporter [Nitratireductor sp. CH_MIT9313-5]|uniref:cation diffusion facilitator family transporter n=1 Tax=Nitratireductor sp. CH_MIT9313-5 TaxID=3107764 RepID=UPI003009F791